MIGLESPPENPVAGPVKGSGMSRPAPFYRSHSDRHGEGHAITGRGGAGGLPSDSQAEGRGVLRGGGDTQTAVPRWIGECPRLCEPAAVNVFNYSFLLYRASNFHLRAGHLHLRAWPALLLFSTAPIFPPGMSRMGPGRAGGPSLAQGTHPVTDLPRSPSARPTPRQGP